MAAMLSGPICLLLHRLKLMSIRLFSDWPLFWNGLFSPGFPPGIFLSKGIFFTQPSALPGQTEPGPFSIRIRVIPFSFLFASAKPLPQLNSHPIKTGLKISGNSCSQNSKNPLETGPSSETRNLDFSKAHTWKALAFYFYGNTCLNKTKVEDSGRSGFREKFSPLRQLDKLFKNNGGC